MLRYRVPAVLLALLIPLSVSGAREDQGLLEAAAEGRLAEVEALLEKGADKDAKTDDGTTALMLAARAGHTEIVRALLEAGADASATNHEGETALMASAARGDTASVLLLLDAGADVKAKSANGNTALKAARKGGRKAVTLVLLQAGAEATDEEDMVPITLAEPGVRVMRGAPHHRIIVRETPPLVEAAARGDAEAVQALLDAGADVNEEEAILGWTALDMAKNEGHEKIVEILIKAGAKEKRPKQRPREE